MNKLYENLKDVGGCHEWQLGKDSYGYGKIWIPELKRQIATHRVAYMLKHGDIPDGLCVRHKCDNPPCCNTDHLILGTRSDNNRDRDERKRHRPMIGSEHGMSKLDENQVRDIRARLAAGALCPELGEEFGVTRWTINAIKNNKTWKHV